MIRIREAPWVDPSAFGYLVSNNPTRIMADTADIIFDQEETQVRPSYHSTMSSQGSKAEGKRVIPLIPKSKVWRHYRDCFDGEHVTCKLCTDQGKQTKYKVCDGSTGTIRDHIEKKHPAEFKDIKAEETKEKAESKENKNKRAKLEANQPTLKDTINKFTKVDPQHLLFCKSLICMARRAQECLVSPTLAAVFIGQGYISQAPHPPKHLGA